MAMPNSPIPWLGSSRGSTSVTSLQTWFWWGYGVCGVLGWGLVGLIWWRSGDFWHATDSVMEMVASLTRMAGFALALVLLFSTACAVAFGVVILPIMGVVWIVNRQRR